MYTKYDLSLKKYNIKIDIMFQLIGRSFSFSGTPVWQIEGHDSGYYYGIDLDIDDHTQKDLIERIKQHSASSSK
ncbi:hypothetical protein BFG57_11520 [Bacillus solimangrovi]|uniref:Uncharacterized protein n=2 Tax=Bacillus solimangrovi TaxID=1305675 RepID=A0A1E5LHV4_9BACI|nr:hypothetical protein BFG57_11520 [Bacillus solimangrovi]